MVNMGVRRNDSSSPLGDLHGEWIGDDVASRTLRENVFDVV
jgi:hypothetical protein